MGVYLGGVMRSRGMNMIKIYCLHVCNAQRTNKTIILRWVNNFNGLMSKDVKSLFGVVSRKIGNKK